jgi:hypothetical protein
MEGRPSLTASHTAASFVYKTRVPCGAGRGTVSSRLEKALHAGGIADALVCWLLSATAAAWSAPTFAEAAGWRLSATESGHSGHERAAFICPFFCDLLTYPGTGYFGYCTSG